MSVYSLFLEIYLGCSERGNTVQQGLKEKTVVVKSISKRSFSPIIKLLLLGIRDL